MRQAKLAEILAEEGHEVTTFALDKISLSGVTQAATAEACVNGADCIILPLPVLSKNRALNTPLSEKVHTVKEVLLPVSGRPIVCAGRVDAETAETAGEMGIDLVDYFDREELTVANASITAEGAVQIIMEELPAAVNGLKVLVIGYGRIGKLLAHKLRGLGADVAVAARKCADIAWIQAYGYRPEVTSALEGRLGEYGAIINTVPRRILDDKLLEEVKPGCFCLDLASKPGGMDFAAAAQLGLKAMWALGLPGEVAPMTAGRSIRDTIFNILEERVKSE